jgi:predicted PurR-regulated permease PerM
MDFVFGIIGAVAGVIVALIVQAVLLKSRKEQVIKDAEKEGENLKKK